MATFEDTSIGFKAVYQNAFNAKESIADKLATRIDSTDLSEHYTWLGNFPTMSEWIGARGTKALTDYGYIIKNKKFEASVSVPNEHIEYDKVGLYKPAIEQMAQNAKTFGSDLAAQCLIKGHISVCYDGKNFFASDHEVGDDTFSNSGTGELNNENVITATALMMSIKKPNGEPLRVQPNIIVCGAHNLANVMAVVDKSNLANGETNPLYKKYEYVILPEIEDMTWFLLDGTKPIKALILQVAKDGVFQASNADDFKQDDSLFGVKSFMNAGYGLWQFAYRSTGV